MSKEKNIEIIQIIINSFSMKFMIKTINYKTIIKISNKLKFFNSTFELCDSFELSFQFNY
jgi:hypothetical protein